MRNRQREDDILDSISELVDQQLAVGPRDDYHRDYLARIDAGVVQAETCARCGGEFHGLPRGRCPGTLSTTEAVEWIKRRESQVLVSGTNENPRYHLFNNVELGSAWLAEGEYILPAPGHVCRIEVNEDGVIRCADCGATAMTDDSVLGSPQHPPISREPRRDINWSVNICGHSTLDFADGEYPVCHDCGITVRGDPTDSGRFTHTIPDGPPMIPGVDVRLGGREPTWLSQMIEATEEYVEGQIEAVTGMQGYTIADLHAMREQWWNNRPYGYGVPGPSPTVRLWDSEFNHIATVQPEPIPIEPVHIGTQITNVRFYGVVTDAENPEPMQATLEFVGSDTGLTLSIPFIEGPQGPPPYTFNEDAATLSVDFVPVGTIAEDAIEMQSDCTDLVPWSGNEPISTTHVDDPLVRAQRSIMAIRRMC